MIDMVSARCATQWTPTMAEVWGYLRIMDITCHHGCMGVRLESAEKLGFLVTGHSDHVFCSQTIYIEKGKLLYVGNIGVHYVYYVLSLGFRGFQLDTPLDMVAASLEKRYHNTRLCVVSHLSNTVLRPVMPNISPPRHGLAKTPRVITAPQTMSSTLQHGVVPDQHSTPNDKHNAAILTGKVYQTHTASTGDQANG